jgi:hypothetical protein
MSATHPTSGAEGAKGHPAPRLLTFGDFVAGVYRAWGDRKAKGVIQLAVKAHLIEFRGQQRFEIF